MKFLEQVYKDLRIESLFCDNGREFQNVEVREWCRDHNITQRHSIPYHHESNGRIERANRTIREAMKKTAGKLKDRLSAVITSYNNMYHRGIKMTPNQGIKPENRKRVLEHQEKIFKGIWESANRQFFGGGKYSSYSE